MNGAAQRGSMSNAERTLLVLLIASIFINYIDRSNLSIAAPLIAKELSLSPARTGTLLAAFFWTYALFQLCGLAGWLADRYPVKLVFAAGFLIWSAATVVTGCVSGYTSLSAARLLLGAGESLAYPCYSRIFAAEIRQEHRGRANALLDAASKLGPALGTFIAGLFLAHFGWRIFFVALGAGGLVWLVPWSIFVRRDMTPANPAPRDCASVASLLRMRSAWGTFAGHFCGNYFWFFLLTWIPSYLVRERGLSIASTANLVSTALAIIAGATLLAGWVSDRLIMRGYSTGKVRKAVVTSGLTLSCIVLPAAFVSGTRACAWLLIASCAAFGCYTSNHWAITQTLAGPQMAGRWTSIQNGIGSLAGVVAPSVAGFIVEQTGSSKLAFVISGVVALAGAAMWGFVVGPVEEVDWRKKC